MKVKFLEARNGDSILISFSDSDGASRNVLIDGGPPSTYQYKNKKGKYESGALKQELDHIDSIDLLILTHVDDDHIGGILQWFSKDPDAKNKVKKVWFNSGQLISERFKGALIEGNSIVLKDTSSLDTSIKQGISFEEYISSHAIWERAIIDASKNVTLFGLKFQFLSPDDEKLRLLLKKWKKEDPNLDTATSDDYSVSLKDHISADLFKEDKSIHNGSSIAFIITFNGKNLVFLGDAHPRLVEQSLTDLGYSPENKLEAEFVKVSHHGSKSNTSYELLNLIETHKYIISSNGAIHNLPHKQCLARIINHNNSAELYFNYSEKPNEIFSTQDLVDFSSFKIFPIVSEFEI